MNEKPKYAPNDKVSWRTGPRPTEVCRVVDGPFEPGVSRVGATGAFPSYSYAVVDGNDVVHMLGEDALAPLEEEWRVCPGEHFHDLATREWMRRSKP